MNKLLIIDDEELIVQGLAHLFESQDDLELEVYKAYSAYEALDWLQQTKIDIVLSDIRMPGMTGLALQREIVRLWPHTIVIFLTGYEDFNYIHTASRNQSFDYILKTEEDEVIVNAVRSAVLQLDRKFEREQLLQQANEQMLMALPMLQKEWLHDLMAGEFKDKQELQKRMAQLNIQLDVEMPVLIMLGRVEDGQPDGRAFDGNMKGFSLHSIVNDILSPAVRLFSCMYERGRLVWFIQPKAEASSNPEKVEVDWKHAGLFVSQSLEQIQKECKKHLGISVSLLAGERAVEWQECDQAIHLLKRILYIDYGLQKEVLLSEAHLSSSERIERDKKITFQLQMNKLERLQTYLETSQSEPFLSLFYELVHYLEMENNDHMKLQWYYSIVPMFLGFLNESSIEENDSLQVEIEKLIYLSNHFSWEEAIDYLVYLANIIFDSRKMDETAREQEVIAKINAFIANNLAGDLSLTRIGDSMGFNPSYLSRLYKQLTGEGLHEYITKMKLHKAKELLNQPHMKVHEISSQLGFESPAYFTKFFKRAANLTPSEYREKQVRW